MSSSERSASPPPETATESHHHKKFLDMIFAIVNLAFYHPSRAILDGFSDQETARLSRLGARPPLWLDPITEDGQLLYLILGVPRVLPRLPSPRPASRPQPPQIFIIKLHEDSAFSLHFLQQANIPKVVFEAETTSALLQAQYGIQLQGAMSLQQLWGEVGRATGRPVDPAACVASKVGDYLSDRERPRWEQCQSEVASLCDAAPGGWREVLEQWPLPEPLRMYCSYIVHGMRRQETACRRILKACSQESQRRLLASQGAEAASRSGQEQPNRCCRRSPA